MHNMEFNGGPLDSLRKEMKLAEIFDQELPVLQRRACEPSLLGGGGRGQSVIDSLQGKADGILAEVRKLKDEGEELNHASRDRMEHMAGRMKIMKDMLAKEDPPYDIQ